MDMRLLNPHPVQPMNYQPDSIQGFHIELTNICTLKCAGCARTRFIQQWPSNWKNHSIDFDQLFNFLNIDLTGKVISLCGNYGDPIYHPKILKIVAGFKQHGACLTISTNGSYKTADWWTELCTLLDINDKIIFSIDGVPENFTQYRVNADWNSIKIGLEICAASAVQTIWKYIPFSFNEHNIDQARSMSQAMNIDKFVVRPSDRFDPATEYLKPKTVEFIGSRFDTQTQFKTENRNNTINAECIDNKSHYISADGFYMPCCYVGDHRFYYKTQFGKNKNSYNIKDQTLLQLLEKPTTIEFYNNLEAHSVCQYNCPNTL